LVEVFLYFSGPGHFFQGNALPAESFVVLPDDVVAQLDTFRTNKDPVRSLYEGVSLACRPAAEAAYRLRLFNIRSLGHYYVPIRKLNLVFCILHIIVYRSYLRKLFSELHYCLHHSYFAFLCVSWLLLSDSV
jgi:hypothetical protein